VTLNALHAPAHSEAALPCPLFVGLLLIVWAAERVEKHFLIPNSDQGVFNSLF
jgi:hypothetical protein